MKADTVIKNAAIVRPDRCIEGHIAVQEGRVVQISAGSPPQGGREIDARGRYVIPGLIDPHMHFDWPDWDLAEGTRSATRAAAAGGYSTVIHHLSGAGSLEEIFRQGREIVEANACIDTGFHLAVFNEEQVAEIPRVARLGVPSFKFFLPYRGSEVVPPLTGIDDGIVYCAMEAIAGLGYPGLAMVHCENVEIFFRLKDRVLREGRGDRVNWADVRPVVCELESIGRIACFSEITGCPVYIVHVSSKQGAAAIKGARERGVRMTGETCPQYLTLTAGEIDRVLGKVNPPIRREQEHSQSLWQALNSGALQTIGSDHAPCARKHKQEFWEAVVGVAGIQTVLPVLLSEGVNRNRISINKLVEVTSYNPARTFGLYPDKGAIEVGAWADLTILDMQKKQVVRAAELHHISDFSLYEGRELTGWPVLTMVRGTVVAEDGEVIGEPGTGRYVPRVPGQAKV
ncbi:MAG: amidohydrolase family protein [Spirochaetales bacterium]|nr:amidohydrolase family protein [Spirochaetales bacterium]